MLTDFQTRALTFLEQDHGEARLQSPLEVHPLHQEFSVKQGDIIADFEDGVRFLIPAQKPAPQRAARNAQ